MASTVFTVSADSGLLQRFDFVTAQQGRTRSEVIRELMQQWLDKQREGIKAETMLSDKEKEDNETWQTTLKNFSM